MKNKNGISAVDVIIAVFILTVFMTTIATVLFNVYLSSESRKRNMIATNYAVKAIEEIRKIPYTEVDTTLSNSLKTTLNISNGYEFSVNTIKYNESIGNTSKEDFVKTVEVLVKYKIGYNEKEIKIKTLKTI